MTYKLINLFLIYLQSAQAYVNPIRVKTMVSAT